jgi:hypothetical protein
MLNISAPTIESSSHLPANVVSTWRTHLNECGLLTVTACLKRHRLCLTSGVEGHITPTFEEKEAARDLYSGPLSVQRSTRAMQLST